MSKYYTVTDAMEMRFIKTPKVVIESDRYRDLSAATILAYSIMLDRYELSIKNNWVDEKGRIYMIYDREELGHVLRVGRKTASRYIKELEAIGLLEDVRMGLNKPNRIYMKRPIVDKEYLYEKLKKDTQTIENYGRAHKGISGNPQKGHQEELKGYTSDTNLSDTDFSDTQSFNHSKESSDNNNIKQENIKDKEKKDRKKDNTDKANIEELNKILDKAEINEYILEDKYRPAKRAIECLYYRNKPLEVNGMAIPQEQIREDLKSLNHYHVEIAFQIFSEVSGNQKIRNKIAYLAVCIYNAIFDMDLKIHNDLRFDGII